LEDLLKNPKKPFGANIGVQPATGLNGCGAPIYPELRFACTGLSMFIPYRGEERESINQNGFTSSPLDDARDSSFRFATFGMTDDCSNRTLT